MIRDPDQCFTCSRSGILHAPLATGTANSPIILSPTADTNIRRVGSVPPEYPVFNRYGGDAWTGYDRVTDVISRSRRGNLGCRIVPAWDLESQMVQAVEITGLIGSKQ
jgi:hypothetical protein